MIYNKNNMTSASPQDRPPCSVNEDRLIDLFLNLCKINSPSLNEQHVVGYVKKFLQEQGLEVIEDTAGKKIGGQANNLIAWLRGDLRNVPKIFLSAHFDTVESTEGLEISEEDGVFRSKSDTILGADDKGGMAPAIEAVLRIKELGIPHGDICLLLSVAEEIGLKGAGALEIEDLGLDFGYVLDTGPPVGSFVNRTATHDKIEIIVHGIPAHAGKDPEKGVNAIVVAAHAISKLKIGRIDPETTTNIGIISGGSAVNVVCPSVTLRAEARSTSVETLDQEVGILVRTFEATAREWGATVEIHHDRHYSAYLVDEDTPVARLAVRAAKKLGYDPKMRTTLGGSDANIYNEKGLPCLVMATGMDKIHTHDEIISRADLIATAQLALSILIEGTELETN